jgi:hypothetical protein
MNRPTFVTMSTLVFTIIAYATLTHAARAGETPGASTVSSVTAALEMVHVQGR